MVFLRKTFGWLLTVLSAYLLITCVFCTGAALFGGLETESFEEQIAISAIFLILAVLFLRLLRLGLRIKKIPAKPEFIPKTEPAPQRSPTVLKELHREFIPAPNAFYSF